MANWIPAFAGMTPAFAGMTADDCVNATVEIGLDLLQVPDLSVDLASHRRVT